MNSSEFILLHTTRYGENSIILHTLSKEYGRKGFFVKNISRRAVTSMFFPLGILEADIYENGRSRLFNARNISMKYPLGGIRNNMRKSAISIFISEVLYRVVKEGIRDTSLYEMCEKNIRLLDAVEDDFTNFHLYFLLEFIVALGFRPSPENLEPFTGEFSEQVVHFMKLPFSEAMLMPLSGDQRSRIAEKLLRYIEYHTEAAVNINSLKVLHEIFR